MNRDLILTAISLGIWGLGEGLFIYFQPLNLQRLGAEPAAIGGILGAAGLAMALAHIPAGYISDRIGARPLMWAAWVLGFLATGIMAFSEDLAGFVIGLLLYNFTAFVSSPMSSYVSSHRGKMSVGRALTLTSGFYSVGMIAGPQIGGLIGNQLGLSMVYKIAFAIFSVSVLVILFIRPNSLEKEQHEHEPNASIKRNRLFLMLLPLLGLITFVNFMPQTFSPNYLQNQQNLDLAAIGGLGSLGSLSNAVFMLALGNLRPAFGLLLGQALVGCFTLLLLFGNDLIWFQLGYLLLGSTRLGRSMALAFARRFIRADETGLAFGLIETLNGGALFLASALAGLLYARQPNSIYSIGLILVGVSIAVSAVMLPWLSRRHAPQEAA